MMPTLLSHQLLVGIGKGHLAAQLEGLNDCPHAQRCLLFGRPVRTGGQQQIRDYFIAGRFKKLFDDSG
jgi:hypothetical protein